MWQDEQYREKVLGLIEAMKPSQVAAKELVRTAPVKMASQHSWNFEIEAPAMDFNVKVSCQQYPCDLGCTDCQSVELIQACATCGCDIS